MVEVSLAAAVDKLDAATERERKEGLNELKHFLGHHRDVSQLRPLKDVAFHKVLESLFGIVQKQRQAYIKNVTKAKTSTASKLSNTADALRDVVELGVWRLKPKTALAVLDHIVEALPSPDGGLCNPLQSSYLRTFRVVLQVSSHGEHLKPEKWQDLVDFLLECVAFVVDTESVADSHESLRESTADLRTGSHLSLRTSQSSLSRLTVTRDKVLIRDILTSLKHLVSVTNAPLLSRAEGLLSVLLPYVKSSTRSFEPAVEIINLLLIVLRAEEVALMKHTLTDLIPTIRRLWKTKSAPLREQLLTTLILCDELLLQTLQPEWLLEADLLESLLSSLRSDYQLANARDRLQIEHLTFSPPASQRCFRLLTLAPQLHIPEAVAAWTQAWTIATLVISLENQRNQTDDGLDLPQDAPRKRAKVTGELQEVIDTGLKSSGNERIVALQTLTFLIHRSSAARMLAMSQLPALIEMMNEQDHFVVSWSHLLLSELAASCSGEDPKQPQFWTRAFVLATKSFYLLPTSRTAAHLLSVLLRESHDKLSAERLMQVLFPDHNTGPPLFCDSALILWYSIFSRLGVLAPEAYFLAGQRFYTWLQSLWTLSGSPDHMQNAHTAHHGKAEIILKVVLASIGIDADYVCEQNETISSQIYRFMDLTGPSTPFHRYILGLDQDFKAGAVAPRSASATFPRSSQQHRASATDTILHRLTQFQAAFLNLCTQTSTSANRDVLEMVATVCIVAVDLSRHLSQELATQKAKLGQLSLDTWKLLCVSMEKLEPQIRQASLTTIARTLLRVQPTSVPEYINVARARSLMSEMLMMITTTDAPPAEPESQPDSISINLEASMDTELSSQPKKYNTTGDAHHYLTYTVEESNLYYLTMSQIAMEQSFAKQLDDHILELGQGYVDFVEGLKPQQIIAIRLGLMRFRKHEFTADPVLASRLLEKLAQSCLQEDEFERCEAALCLCLDLLSAFSDVWVISNDEIGAVAADVYTWFIKLLRRGFASQAVECRIVQVLQEVLQLDADYGSNMSLPSPRTLMLQRLQNGGTLIRYVTSGRLLTVFGRNILSEHGAIFDDILDHLPNNLELLSDLVVRMNLLETFAKQWFTLFRPAVYRIFETAALAPETSVYASQALNGIARHLRLSGPRSLLSLLAPQLFYTWHETGSLNQIPFQAFGYSSLAELVTDYKMELVGQAAMRSSQEHQTQLVRLLSKSWPELIHDCFSKVEGYSVAKDVSVPREDDQAKSSESFIRKDLGPETYLQLIRSKVPEIIAVLFNCLGDDEAVERSFERNPAYADAKKVYASICSRGKSDTMLEFAAMQPCFRGKYLVDELDFLCKRTNMARSEIFVSASVTFISRSLFEANAKELGPLNSCLILRRLRVLLALAGKTAVSGYLLEMLLRNVQPYLTDFYCSEDAIGIFCYLVEHGVDHLRTRLPFLTSLIVNTFIQLIEFTRSEQQSTTQISQFEATMSKAHRFREWLKRFVDRSTMTSEEGDLISRFHNLCTLAALVTKNGSCVQGTREGDLILAILRDQITARPLFSREMFLYTLATACSDFSVPSPGEADILAGIANLSEVASLLRGLLHHPELSTNFRMWVVQVLGRLYGSSWRPGDSSSEETVASGNSPVHQSHAGLLGALTEIVQQVDNKQAGLAEWTMQRISSDLTDAERMAIFGPGADHEMLSDLAFTDFPCPPANVAVSLSDAANDALEDRSKPENWMSAVAVHLCQASHHDLVLPSLLHISSSCSPFVDKVFSKLVHVALRLEQSSSRPIHQWLSELFSTALQSASGSSPELMNHIVDTLLYLRQQPYPNETTINDRGNWLDVDVAAITSAALELDRPKVALLFLEVQISQHALLQSRSTRKSSIRIDSIPSSILPPLSRVIDDPDYFYGFNEEPSLEAIAQKFSHEQAGFKNVAFQSALLDSQIKLSKMHPNGKLYTDRELARALSSANLEIIAQAVQSWSVGGINSLASEKSNVEQLKMITWDLQPPSPQLSLTTIVSQLQSKLEVALSPQDVHSGVEDAFQGIAAALLVSKYVTASHLSSMAVVSSTQEILAAASLDKLQDICAQYDESHWGMNESFDNVSFVLRGRETAFGFLKANKSLRDISHMDLVQVLRLEAQNLLSSVKTARGFQEQQFCLNRATYLTQLAEHETSPYLKVDAVAQHVLARVLWDFGEVTAPIQILKGLKDRPNLSEQDLLISRVEVLTDLSYNISASRLEKPDDIIINYVHPAIKALNGVTEGNEAGRVFHSFAQFCDQLLQNQDDYDDFTRIESIRNRKEEEVQELERMYKASNVKETKESLRSHLSKARTWFKLDDEEYKRLRANREGFVRSALKNYLLALRACDLYGNDVLRFLALWLGHSTNDTANASVGKLLPSIPSHKFAALMNQLCSRILDAQDGFQIPLTELLLQICKDHPYHSLYHIFATSKSKPPEKDDVAVSRYEAAKGIVKRIMNDNSISRTWAKIHNNSIAFVRFAQEEFDMKRIKSGSKMMLKDSDLGKTLLRIVGGSIGEGHINVPPPTMQIHLRADRDYSTVPTLVQFDSQFSLAGGVSAPKIVTAVASDGSRHKMLLKGGNDDLRQDSIMEQVFEQVSNLLRDHRETRRRKLGIRTYRVLPLTYNAGVIEFVKDTIPLHDYLLPAHQRYYPKDYKPNRCRKETADAQSAPQAQRVQTYRNICEHFHPVMRFFFMERFPDPDDWFQKRLNYTRSTAAISILGHVLGVGDRHGHNILLDERTGEVVHIDLGVAFEAGRILPVPELVPFRLTRDCVDGMGMTGVEGVFRRCCNFTLETLRQEQDSIMTILDVLRYDPLHSWSVSPLRLARMQQEQEANVVESTPDASAATPAGRSLRSDVPATAITSVRPSSTLTSGKFGLRHNNLNEPSEADRALAMVSKKLGKSLSAEATVNELIRQATDEKNLAVLYCGWAAYA